jgi:hypothetical protein
VTIASSFLPPLSLCFSPQNHPHRVTTSIICSITPLLSLAIVFHNGIVSSCVHAICLGSFGHEASAKSFYHLVNEQLSVKKSAADGFIHVHGSSSGGDVDVAFKAKRRFV